MTKYYKSKYYDKPIEVENIDWEILVIINDNLGRESIYSWYDVEEKNTESIYINKCLLWGFIKKIPENVLIIWFWWWAFTKYLEDHIVNINITWIDIDEAMIKIAKNELKVKINDIYISDCLEAFEKIIEKNKKQPKNELSLKYDLILIDVYWSDWKIPEYFSEKIFCEKINEILKKDWTISINYSNYDLENNKYKKIHSNFLDVFSKYYSHILSWKNDKWNVMWIYNLNKFYSAKDYDNNYLKQVKNWKILFDEKIINNTVVK